MKCLIIVCWMIANKMLTLLPHIEKFAELFKNFLFMSALSTILENTDGCAEQYRCASALYIMSVVYQCYSVIIDRGISAPRHGKEVVNGINTIDKRYIYQLMSNV